MPLISMICADVQNNTQIEIPLTKSAPVQRNQSAGKIETPCAMRMNKKNMSFFYVRFAGIVFFLNLILS